MKIFDDEVFDGEMLTNGEKEIQNEGGFSSSLGNDVTNGLISLISALINDSESFKKVFGNNNNLLLKKTGLIEKILKMIVNFFNNLFIKNKENPKVKNEENTLINNQNFDMKTLQKENEILNRKIDDTTEKMEKLIEALDNINNMTRVVVEDNSKILKDINNNTNSINK